MRINLSVGSKILILGDQPTEYAAKTNEIFGGNDKRRLQQVLTLAEISPVEVSMGYISGTRAYGGGFEQFFVDGKRSKEGTVVASLNIPKPSMQENLTSLKKWILSYKPNVIVTLGANATKVLTGLHEFDLVRGTVLRSRIFPAEESQYEVKVIPTYDLDRLVYERHNVLVITWDIKKAIAHSEFPEIPSDPRTLVPNASAEEFIRYARWLLEWRPLFSSPEKYADWKRRGEEYGHQDDVSSGVALDIENTIGHGCHITQFGIGHSKNFAMTIKFLRGIEPALAPHEEVEVLRCIADLSKSQHLKWIMQNCQHDISVTWMNMSILFECSFDTMLAAQLLWPELRKGLGFLSSICLDVPAWKHVSGEETYNPEDVANTKGVYEVLQAQIKGRGLTQIFSAEMSQVPVAVMLGLQGIKVDKSKRQEIREHYTKLHNDLEKLLRQLVKDYGMEDMNFGSPAQIKTLLYDKLGLPKMYARRKSIKDPRKLTSDAEALRKLSEKSASPIPKLLIQKRKLAKGLSSYLDFPLSPWGTAHTTYKIGSATEFKKAKKGSEDNKSLGRWSSAKSIILPYGTGNLQAIPQYARRMYVPFEDDWEIGCGDYMQAEAVVVAYLSSDEILINAINSGNALRQEKRGYINALRRHGKDYKMTDAELEYLFDCMEEVDAELHKVDIHNIKAAATFGVDIKQVDKEMRTIGKVLRHETNYDGGAGVLQAQLAKQGIFYEINKCKQMLEHDAKINPSLRQWHEAIRIEASSTPHRELSNPFGRKRRFLADWNEDLWKRLYAFKPQSTVGDLLNTALVRFYNKWAHQIRILLQLHDGIYISYPKKERQLWLTRLREEMLIPMTINDRRVVIDVDCKAGPNWEEMEDVFI